MGRIKAGIARVKETGKTESGNAIGRPKTDAKAEQFALLAAQHPGTGIIKLAKQFGVGVSVVQRVLAA